MFGFDRKLSLFLVVGFLSYCINYAFSNNTSPTSFVTCTDVNVTLDPVTCTYVLKASDFIINPAPNPAPVVNADYLVTIQGTNRTTLGVSDLGRKYTVTIRYIPNNQIVCDKSTVCAFDGAPPVITCPSDVTIGCHQLTAGASPPITLTGDLGLDDTVLAVDGSVTECQPITKANQFSSDCLDFSLNCKTTPRPTFTQANLINSCANLTPAQITDLMNRITTGLAANPNIIRVIVRCWYAADKPVLNRPANISEVCYQVIFVTRYTLADVIAPTNLIYTCSRPDAVCNIPVAPADLSPNRIGWPKLDTNNDGIGDYELNPANNNVCDILISFTDQTTSLCTNSRKITRTFTILDCCTGATRTIVQIIELLDTHQPIVKANYINFLTTSETRCLIDRWGVRNPTGLVLSKVVAQPVEHFFGGYFKQICNATQNATNEVYALADPNVCGRATVTFNFNACDPECTNDEVTMTSNSSIMNAGRRFIGRQIVAGVNHFLYEFKATLTDIGNDGFEIITFTAADKCGKALATHTYHIYFIDNISPGVACIDKYQLSLGSDGKVRLDAALIANNAIKDNCTPLSYYIRRLDGLKCNTASTALCQPSMPDPDSLCYRSFIDFCCCDAGKTIKVELIAVDENGNFSICCVPVDIVNKQKPICFAPPTATTDCRVNGRDISLIMADSAQRAQLFGTAFVSYNCTYELTESVTANLGQCDHNTRTLGFFTRTWKVKSCTDSSTCTQRIDVRSISDFTVDFPDDRSYNCFSQVPTIDSLRAQMLDPLSWGVRDGAIRNDGCGKIAIAIDDDTLTVADGSFKIERKICVYDCCKFNPNNILTAMNTTSYGIPVCGDVHSVSTWATTNIQTWQNLRREHLLNTATVAPLTTAQRQRYYNWIATGSPTNTGNPVDNPNWDRLFFCDSTRTLRQLFAERRFRDADALAGQGPTTDNPTEPWAYSDGVICFIQVIKVAGGTEFAPLPHGDEFRSCYGNVTTTLAATAGTCEAGTVTFAWQLFRQANLTTAIASGNTSSVTYNFNEYGDFIVKWSATKNSVTKQGTNFKISVKDLINPTISIRTPLPNLVANNNGGMDITFSDLVQSLSDNCTETDLAFLTAQGSIELFTNRFFYPGRIQKNITIPADSVNNGRVTLVLFTRDRADNIGSVTVVLTRPAFASISGRTLTEQRTPVGNVRITATNNNGLSGETFTSSTGEFLIQNLPANQSIQIKAEKTANDDKYKGVTTYDIAVISAHILNVKRLASPYAFIAADVNGSGDLDGADMLLIRNFILRRTDKLPSGTWCFIDKNYNFKNPEQPLGEDFPQSVNMTLQKGTNAADFVAVKMGDVFTPSTTTERQVKEVILNTDDITLKAGQSYTIFIKTNDAHAATVQGTLAFDGATVQSIQSDDLGTGNFAMFKQSVTLGWENKTTSTDFIGTGSVGEAFKTFAITFIAQKDGQLSKMLRLDNSLTPIEAVDNDGKLLNVFLVFNNKNQAFGEFALYQNTPNPATGETTIGFNLPKEGSARLTVYNAEGKTVKTIAGDYKGGYNQVRLQKSDLEGNGIYYYRLDTPEASATRRMVWIQ